MKRLLSTITAALVCVLAVFAISGCTSVSVEEAKPQLSPKVTAPTIGQDGVLRVGVSYKNPPFSVESNSKVQGIDVDLAAALAQEMGLTVQFTNIGDNGGNDEIASGMVDIVMAGATDGSAGKDVTVVGRYLDNAPGLFTVTSSGEPVVATMQDVESNVVAVQGNSVSDNLIKRLFPTAKRLQLRTLNECFEAVNSGQAKYVACDSYAGAYLAVGYDNIAYAGTLEIPNSMGICVSSKNTELQKTIQTALDSLSTNGTLALIKSKWVGNLPAISTETQVLTAEQRVKAASQAQTNASAQPQPHEAATGVTGENMGTNVADPSAANNLTPGGNVDIPGQNDASSSRR